MSEAQESPEDGLSKSSQALEESQEEEKHNEESQEELSNTKKVYLESNSNSSKKLLFLMCVSLMDGGSATYDLDEEPWNALKKQDIKPARLEYADEVCQHGNFMSDGVNCIHKPANWSVTKCIECIGDEVHLELNALKGLKIGHKVCPHSLHAVRKQYMRNV